MAIRYCTTKGELRQAVTRKLRENLSKKQISIRGLAAELRISKSHIQRLTDDSTPGALETLFELARYFEIPYKFEFTTAKRK